MTMPTDIAQPPRAYYVEDGATLVHPIPFKFIAAAHISVVRTLLDGTEILLAQPADYTVQGGDYAVGQITKLAAGVAGAELRIDRNTPREQPLDYIQGDDFSAESHEHGLDRLTMIAQELHRDALTRADVLDIIEEMLAAGDGIDLDREGDTLTITNTYNAAFIIQTIGEALVGLSGIEITPGTEEITIRYAGATSIGELADMLLLSGDQQGGGLTGTGDGSFSEQVRAIIFAALQGIGITINQDDDANTITLSNDVTPASVLALILGAIVEGVGITVEDNGEGQVVISAPNAGVSLEDVRDMLATCLANGTLISIVPNDAGDQIVINSTALDPSYRGIVPSARNAAFDFADDMGGRATNWTGAAGIGTLRLESGVALSAGWVHRIRNTGTGALTIHREAGVSLKKNGSTASADAVIAIGGTATIERWGADDFTITGPGVS